MEHEWVSVVSLEYQYTHIKGELGEGTLPYFCTGTVMSILRSILLSSSTSGHAHSAWSRPAHHLVAAEVTCNYKRDKIRWRKGHARVRGGALPVEKKNQVELVLSLMCWTPGGHGGLDSWRSTLKKICFRNYKFSNSIISTFSLSTNKIVISR
jgi:hypothetical protein